MQLDSIFSEHFEIIKQFVPNPDDIMGYYGQCCFKQNYLKTFFFSMPVFVAIYCLGCPWLDPVSQCRLHLIWVVLG